MNRERLFFPKGIPQAVDINWNEGDFNQIL